MKHHVWLFAAALTFLPSAMARAQQAERVLFVNAQQEGVTCVAPRNWPSTCADAPATRTLDTLHAVELQVINRRFFTDYNVEITAAAKIEGARIRGLEEAASLTLSAPSLIPPPAKGPVPSIEPKTATAILAALLDETESGSQEAVFRADEAELERQIGSAELTVKQLQAVLDQLRGSSAPYGAVLGSPSLLGVYEALAGLLEEATAAPFIGPPFVNEDAFRRLIVRVGDRLMLVRNFQHLLSQVNLPDQTADAVAELTQIARNEATFAGNRQAALDALRMYDALSQMRGVRAQLRREQLRLLFHKQLKPAPADAAAVVDDAELNALADSFTDFLDARGFAIADARANAFRKAVAGMQQPAGKRHAQMTAIKTQLAAIDDAVRITLPSQVATVNETMGRLLARVNDIYDGSQTPGRLSKIIDLRAYDANTFGYAVRRVEGFTRYSISMAPRLTLGGSPAASVAALPAAASAAKLAASPAGTGAKPAPAAAPAAAPPEPANEAAPPAPPGEVVASGTFEIHQLDRAAVIAGFAFSLVPKSEYAAQQMPAAGDRAAGLYPVKTSETRGQPHVMLGINYYLRPRDSYPGAATGLAHFGITAGVSANDLHNYFVGVLWEPKLGFNVGTGLHFGKTVELQEPYQSGAPLADATVPTFDRRTVGLYVAAGLDVDIFRKVFGKVSGVGTAAASRKGP